VPSAVPSSRPALGQRRRAHRRSRLAGVRLAQPALALPGHALTGSSAGRRHLSAAGRLIGLLAFAVAVLTENGPGDPGELVGERDGEHVRMQSPLRGCNPLLEPVTLPRLRLDQDHPSGLDKQNAQVAIALFGDLAEDRAASS
jgi:hypothetical protein